MNFIFFLRHHSVFDVDFSAIWTIPMKFHAVNRSIYWSFNRHFMRAFDNLLYVFVEVVPIKTTERIIISSQRMFIKQYFQSKNRFCYSYWNESKMRSRIECSPFTLCREWNTKALETSTAWAASALFWTLSHRVVVCFVFLFVVILFSVGLSLVVFVKRLQHLWTREAGFW